MAAAIFITLMFGQISSSAQENNNSDAMKTAEITNKLTAKRGNDRTLTGVWQTTLTPRNCLTGAPVAPDFQGLITYNDGGTLSEFAAGGNPILRGPGHGVWQRDNGWRTYSVKIIFLRFNANGDLIGKQRIIQTVNLATNGDESTSSGTVEVLDLNGSVLGGGCSTSTATRFE